MPLGVGTGPPLTKCRCFCCWGRAQAPLKARLKAANQAHDDVLRRSKSQNRIEEAKDHLLRCRQLYDDLAIQVGTGLTSAKETLPEIRVGGVAARVATRPAGSQAPTEKCVYCGWRGDLVLCHLCHAEV